jgi:DNA-binding cell septation regulator SpoVG
MSDIKVYYFPSTNESSKIVGGGYVHAGLFNVTFSVMKSQKEGETFRILWPSRKVNDSKWVDDAKPVSLDAKKILETAIFEKMNNGSVEPSPSAKAAYGTSNPHATSPATGPKDGGIPSKPPF